MISTTSRARGTILQVSFFIVSAFIITEALLRLYGLHKPVLYEADEAAGFNLKPNQHIEMLTGTVDINEWGLRDRRSFAPGDSEKRRVLVLGDSVAWGGLRIPQEDLLTARVERVLGDEVNVLNGSVNGASVVQMVRRYEHRWHELKPDVIVVYTIPTSFQRPPIVDLTGDSLAFSTEQPRLALGVALELARTTLSTYPGLQWLRPADAAEPRTALPPEANLEAAVEALAELKQIAEAPVHVILSPTILDDAELRSEIARKLSEAGVSFTDLSNAVPAQTQFYVDPVHFSGQGHEAVAPAVAEIVSELLRTESR